MVPNSGNQLVLNRGNSVVRNRGNSALLLLGKHLPVVAESPAQIPSTAAPHTCVVEAPDEIRPEFGCFNFNRRGEGSQIQPANDLLASTDVSKPGGR
jgi:hypothetical protein